MKYNTFIGVDVSKLTIDAYLHAINVSKTFSNNEKRFASLLTWVKKHGKVSELTKTIVCFEHTGMYSIKLAMYLNEANASFAMLPALQIKQSIGIISMTILVLRYLLYLRLITLIFNLMTTSEKPLNQHIRQENRPNSGI